MERRMDWERMEDSQILEVIRGVPDMVKSIEEKTRLLVFQMDYLWGKLGGIEELRRRHGKRDKV